MAGYPPQQPPPGGYPPNMPMGGPPQQAGPQRTYQCPWCGIVSGGGELSCPACGAPVDVKLIVSPGGWYEQPGIKDMQDGFGAPGTLFVDVPYAVEQPIDGCHGIGCIGQGRVEVEALFILRRLHGRRC